MARQPSSEDDGSATASDHATVEVLWAATDALIDPCVLLEAMRDASGEIVDFCYRHVNQATCDYFGVSRAYLIGSGMLDTTPGIKESLLADFIRCLETGEALILNDFTYDNEILQDTRRYDLRATRATGDYIVLTWRDVTERFEAQTRLAASEAHYRQTIKSAAVGMALFSPDGRFTEFNDALCDFFGYDPTTLLHMTWQELTAPEDLDTNLRNVREILSGQADTYRTTKQYLHADGHRIWGDLSLGCLRNLDGKVEYFIAQITDVTPIERELRERLEFDAFLSDAIADGRLIAYAQPIVDAHTGRVVEEELLVRLVGRDGGVMVPDDFLPQARRFGLMPTIDRFMVARGIELARAGRRVAVNLSAQSINDAATVSTIVEQLRADGDAAARVSFEITEHTALASTDLAERFSADMRRLGCRLALDDFGTGFGSFTELRGMMLDKLKIDRSFVSGLLRNPQDESVVRAIIAIAGEFALLTTAEGVEDVETRNRLIELGVDQLQGFLVGRPAPATRADEPRQ